MATKNLTTYLEDNPRMVGVLFTVMLFLAETGTVMASSLSADAGP